MSEWSSARILYKSHVDAKASDGRTLCEESVRVLLAEDEDSALEKAERIGKENEHEYTNEAGELVRWRFVKVLEIQDLSARELADGVEVYSRLCWEDESAE